MNWEAIGAIGEVGGAIGVVATLGYLAAQIRQNSANLTHNSQAVLAATELENARLAAEWNSEIAGDAELAGLLIRAARREEMTLEEQLRYRFTMASLFYRFEGLYFQKRRGLLSAESFEAWDEVMVNNLFTPAMLEWWHSGFHPFSASFRAHVEALIAERGDLDSDPPPLGDS